MSGLILHSYRRCPFAIRVRMALEEKGLPFQVIEEDLGNRSAELLRLHPEGAVPLLLHEGVAIHESSIITEYIDERFPEHPLMPSAAMGRAQVRLWTYACNEFFKHDVDGFKYEWKDLAEEAREALLARLRGFLSKMDEALARAPFLLGSELTLADIHVFPFYRQLTRARPDFASFFQYPRVDDWLARITGRPSFERVMAKIPAK